MIGAPNEAEKKKLNYQLKVVINYGEGSLEEQQMIQLYEMGFENFEENRAGITNEGFDRYLDRKLNTRLWSQSLSHR